MKLTRTHTFKTTEKLTLRLLREVVEALPDTHENSVVKITEYHGDQREPGYDVTITVTEPT